MSDFISSVRRVLSFKLRGPEFKFWPGTVGVRVSIIMCGTQQGWKLALSQILLQRVNKGPFLSLYIKLYKTVNVENLAPCNVTRWCIQFLSSYRFHKVGWPWTSLKIQKGHIKVNIKFVWDFDVEDIPIKL